MIGLIESVFGKSYRTTAFGLGTILAALGPAMTAYYDTDPATNPDWSVVIVAVLAGLGLMRSRDNLVSSESAGAK